MSAHGLEHGTLRLRFALHPLHSGESGDGRELNDGGALSSSAIATYLDVVRRFA